MPGSGSIFDYRTKSGATLKWGFVIDQDRIYDKEERRWHCVSR